MTDKFKVIEDALDHMRKYDLSFTDNELSRQALTALRELQADHIVDASKMVPAQQATSAEGERAAFEAHIAKDCGDLSTFGSGKNMHYRNSAVNHEWEGWKARALLQSQPAQQAQKPMFWYRPVHNGEMYEGPHHANSKLGAMLREEKPSEWHPLFTNPQRELVQQARDALALPCDRWNKTQYKIVGEAITACDKWLGENP